MSNVLNALRKTIPNMTPTEIAQHEFANHYLSEPKRLSRHLTLDAVAQRNQCNITTSHLATFLAEGYPYERVIEILTEDGGVLMPVHHREWLTTHYAWAIPTPELISHIAHHFITITEIGAGTGYWAKRLHEAGASVAAYDKHPKHDEQTWYPVYEMSADFIPDPNDTLFLCWPTVDDNWATEVLKRYDGENVIYIGENPGGCCANDAFFDELDNNWFEVVTFTIPTYLSIFDTATHYTRRVEIVEEDVEDVLEGEEAWI